jgi:YfiH family protein
MTAEALTADRLSVRHGFFTRRGGVSEGPYASLNCSLSGGDQREAVMQNRARVAEALDLVADNLLGLTQVHGTEVLPVHAPWAPGDGPHADAMVSDQPGLGLGIITADCVPVLFADPVAGVIGAAHAGWRGAVTGILEATLVAMVGLGARAQHVTAAIGPCIGQESYEVSADLRAAVLTHNEADAHFFTTGRREDRWQFDLRGYCAARLHAAGVGHTQVLQADTVADADRFFSHRRRTLAGGGPIGHQISVIAL